MSFRRLHADYTQELPESAADFVGVRRLLAAVLYQAIVDAACHRLGTDSRFAFSPKDGRSAWIYVMSTDRGSLLSFENLCAHFNVDAARARRAIETNPRDILARRRSPGRKFSVLDEEELCDG